MLRTTFFNENGTIEVNSGPRRTLVIYHVLWKDTTHLFGYLKWPRRCQMNVDLWTISVIPCYMNCDCFFRYIPMCQLAAHLFHASRRFIQSNFRLCRYSVCSLLDNNSPVRIFEWLGQWRYCCVIYDRPELRLNLWKWFFFSTAFTTHCDDDAIRRWWWWWRFGSCCSSCRWCIAIFRRLRYFLWSL